MGRYRSKQTRCFSIQFLIIDGILHIKTYLKTPEMFSFFHYIRSYKVVFLSRVQINYLGQRITFDLYYFQFYQKKFISLIYIVKKSENVIIY